MDCCESEQEKIREAFEEEYSICGFCKFQDDMYVFKDTASINAGSSLMVKDLNREFRIFQSGYKSTYSRIAELEKEKAELLEELNEMEELLEESE